MDKIDTLIAVLSGTLEFVESVLALQLQPLKGQSQSLS